jgi:alanine racemase
MLQNMLKAEETILEIDLTALEHNFNFLKSKINDSTKFLAVVKAFGYGSDAVEVATCLEKLGVDYFAVAYTAEGVTLRNAGISAPVLVLHPQLMDFDMIIERCLEPNIYSVPIMDAFISAAKKHRQKAYPVHLKFNTGLNRLGFGQNDIDSIVEKLKNANEIKVASVFSHLAASEDMKEKKFTLAQIALFKKIILELEAKIGYKPLYHQLNTSGILNYAKVAQFDMVRSGIGLYGFGNAPEYNKHLKPIATLKSVISQIHHLNVGDSLGYNKAFIAKKPTRTATLPIGHADGIGRHYGNGKGFVTIHGKKAPVIGNVCMDMLMVDVTTLNCHEGDEVIIFGAQPTAEALAATVGSISYELITGISQRVKRKFIR